MSEVKRPKSFQRKAPRVRHGHQHRARAVHLVVDGETVQLRCERAGFELLRGSGTTVYNLMMQLMLPNSLVMSFLTSSVPTLI